MSGLAGYGWGVYGDVWVDIRQQFVGIASAGHTGESDSQLSCHPSNAHCLRALLEQGLPKV